MNMETIDKKDTSLYKLSGENVFFTADTHFGHTNIIRFCCRPFKDVDEMNETLIQNWNETVQEDALVFHLGDFCHGGAAEWHNLLDRLHGRIILILGNHDLKNMRPGYIDRFEHVTQQMTVIIDGQQVILNHYPFLCYGGSYRDVWQLFGHVHSGPLSKTGLDDSRLVHLFPKQYDVGVDNNNFRPVSFAEVARKIGEQIQASRRGCCLLESGDTSQVVFLDTADVEDDFWRLDALASLCPLVVIAGPLAKEGLEAARRRWIDRGLPGEVVGVTSGEGPLNVQIGEWLSRADGGHRYVSFSLMEQEDFRAVRINNGKTICEEDIQKAIYILEH